MKNCLKYFNLVSTVLALAGICLALLLPAVVGGAKYSDPFELSGLDMVIGYESISGFSIVNLIICLIALVGVAGYGAAYVKNDKLMSYIGAGASVVSAIALFFMDKFISYSNAASQTYLEEFFRLFGKDIGIGVIVGAVCLALSAVFSIVKAVLDK